MHNIAAAVAVEAVANSQGVYNQFTGLIDWHGSVGHVVNANFTLHKGGIDMHEGTWNGVWRRGLFHGKAVWEGGIWVTGCFCGDATWRNGKWENGRFGGHAIWMGGRWEDGHFGGHATWQKGIWEYGEFCGLAVWKGGVWEGGSFGGGAVWEGGMNIFREYQSTSPDTWTDPYYRK